MPGVSLDVSSMKAADLKKELKARGLSVDGKKNELQERLQEALAAAEEDVDEETEKSLLEGKGTPKKTPNKRVSISSAAPEVKIFKRDSDAAATDEEKTPQEKRAERFGIASLSADAKKAARAARFGIVDPAEKKAARAARFGIVDEAEKKAARAAKFGTGPKKVTPEDIEQLKARAARFGEISSKTLKKASLLEKKKERAERFKSGGAAATEKTEAATTPKVSTHPPITV